VAPVKKRSYRSVVRQQHAAQTRARIVDAAAALFVERGYAKTTVQAIAEAAEVAADTVYAVFGSKVRILTAVIDARLAPPGVTNVTERAESQAVRDERDQRRQLHLFATDIAALSTRVRPIFEVLRTASAVEPDARAVYLEMEQHRLANMRRFTEWLASTGPMGADRELAAHTVWALTSPDVARLLCDVLGWSETEHAAWLEETIAAAVLSSPPATRPPRKRAPKR
jgi:AcrR family transcriptional regulator